MTGRVKLHRKVQGNPISTSLELLGLFSFMLLKANHTENAFYLGHQKINLLPGQFVWSMQGIAEQFDISKPKAYRLVLSLEEEQIVIRKGYSKYTLFTIPNWHLYQSDGNAIVTPIVTTNETPPYTNKNDKNDKNDKNKNTPPPPLDKSTKLLTSTTLAKDSLSQRDGEIIVNSNPDKSDKSQITLYGELQNVKLSPQELSQLQERFPDCQKKIEDLSFYIGSVGAKYKSHYATILNWARKAEPPEPKTPIERMETFKKLGRSKFQEQYGQDKAAQINKQIILSQNT